MRIILIEDHDDLREVTVEALAEMGHTVRGLADGSALDAEFVDFRPHLLVLDLNLPGEDGISISSRYRRLHPGIGIVMVTARTQVQQRIEGYGNGANIYLSKPVAFEELAAAIESLSCHLAI